MYVCIYTYTYMYIYIYSTKMHSYYTRTTYIPRYIQANTFKSLISSIPGRPCIALTTCSHIEIYKTI